VRHANAETDWTDRVLGGRAAITLEPTALQEFVTFTLSRRLSLTLRITVHRGSSTVGGSCIEVASDQTRLIFDLGLPLFDSNREPLDSYQLRRMSTAQLTAGGFLPDVTGLFDDQKSPDAILLSHAHLDHTGLLEHSSHDIPVYATVGTSKMMLAGSLFAGQVGLPRERFRELKPEQSLTIGDLTVTPYSVDHSIFDCVALLIEGEGKRVLYTGDLRLHGRKPGMAQRLIDVCSKEPLDALIQEGTHFGLPDGDRQTEYELQAEIVREVSQTKSLVLTSFSPQHVDRLVAFMRAAKQTGRTFVADVYTGFVLHLIASQIPVPRPGESDGLRVYFPEALVKSAGRRGTLGKFESMFQSSRIELTEIRDDPAKHLMVFRPSMLADFGGEFPPETICIYSRWKGYLESPEWEETKNALKENSVCGEVLPEIHTSGHILSEDIIRFVNALRPKTIIPVHTFHPEEFSRQFDRVLLPQDGKCLVLE
jgi:ribonuclease J